MYIYWYIYIDYYTSNCSNESDSMSGAVYTGAIHAVTSSPSSSSTFQPSSEAGLQSINSLSFSTDTVVPTALVIVLILSLFFVLTMMLCVYCYCFRLAPAIGTSFYFIYNFKKNNN